ncbi:MAG TPA: hypothetical protein DGG95_02020 [Cytophagales bacterium]|jgi:hypothetical protein|nr:hypothetical protein [Cytophagales bacterium]
MKNKAYILFFLFTGCTFTLPLDKAKVMPPTKETMLIRQSRLVSNTTTDLTFELDLYHLVGRNYGHYITNYFYIVDTSYLLFPTGKFKIDTAYSLTTASSVPSSTVILIDESGDYDTLDQFNSRSQGITKLCQDFTSPGKYLLGGFSKNGLLQNSPCQFIQADFSTYSQDQLPLIFDLAKKTGGQSNLYDAINTSLDRIANSGNSIQNLIIIAHSRDEVSSVSLQSIITKANVASVQMHVLFLGSETDVNPMAKLAQATGGLFVYCPSIGELMASLENLYTVLQASVYVYRVRIKYSTTNISSGQEFFFQINTHSVLDTNPLVAYVKIP